MLKRNHAICLLSIEKYFKYNKNIFFFLMRIYDIILFNDKNKNKKNKAVGSNNNDLWNIDHNTSILTKNMFPSAMKVKKNNSIKYKNIITYIINI